MIPADAAVAADVFKADVLAGHLWRVGDEVSFRYASGYDGAPVAVTLPLGSLANEITLRVPPFFAGRLPEGDFRRRTLTRALHIAEDDELGLLAKIGADTIGDVQVVPAGTTPPEARLAAPGDLADLSFAERWAVPERWEERSTIAGVRPKLSFRSRSLVGGRAGLTILKFSPDGSWLGVLENEALFMAAARAVGLRAPDVDIVTGRGGWRALAVDRFDRTLVDGRLVHHAQEDAPGAGAAAGAELRPGRPDARTVVLALSEACSAPLVARRDLLHQLLYSYAFGNSDVHAKNLSIGHDPRSGVWSVTPIYGVLHTWPYERDHRFHPAVGDVAHDTVPRRHRLSLAGDLDLPPKVVEKLTRRASLGVAAALPTRRASPCGGSGRRSPSRCDGSWMPAARETLKLGEVQQLLAAANRW